MPTLAEKASASPEATEQEFNERPDSADGEPAETPESEPEPETPETPETPENDDDDEADSPDESEPPADVARTGRGQRTPQEKFHQAFRAFIKKAAECFEILPSDVVVASHPGVVGIMLPGFSEPRTHENFTTCTICNGIGKVLTGAVTGDPTKDYHTCPDTRCKGNGFWQKNTTPAAAPATGPLAVPAVPAGGDEWGEAPAWMGDPNLTPGQ